MDELGRNELRKLLRQIDDASPGTCDALETERAANPVLAKQLKYLKEHGLLTCEIASLLNGGPTFFFNIRITAKGTDYLRDDGGLTAELGVVVVRIDAEQFREMLLARLNSADGVSHEERSELAEQIRRLPGKTLERLIEALLSKGVDTAVQSLPLLGTLIGQALGP